MGRVRPHAQRAARPRRRLRKLRFLAILFAGLLLALISFLYGMFMAVTSDLPATRRPLPVQRTRRTRSSSTTKGRPLGRALRAAPHPARARPDPRDRQARGDLGRGQALLQRARHRPPGHRPRRALRTSCTSTPSKAPPRSPSSSSRTHSKRSRTARSSRSSARPRSPTSSRTSGRRKRSSPSTSTRSTSAKAPTASRPPRETYFGHEEAHAGCGLPKAPLCVEELKPAEAAMLGGIIASPSGFNPVDASPGGQGTARGGAKDMLEQHYISAASTRKASTSHCHRADVQPPQAPPVDGLQTRLLHELGRTAAHRTLRRPARARGRAHRAHHARPRTPARRRTGGRTTTSPAPKAPPHRSSRSKTPRATCARWSAGTTTTPRPSTSRPPASASPARPSRHSTSPTALEHGISPGSVWVSAPEDLHRPRYARPGKVRTSTTTRTRYAGSRSLLEATT